MEKHEILKALNTKKIRLKDLVKKFRNDKEIVLEAIARNNEDYNYASKELQQDEDVILAALNNDLPVSKIIDITGPEIFIRGEFLTESIYNNAETFRFLSKELQEDRDFILEMANVNGGIIKFLNEEFQHDREIILTAVKTAGWALEFALEKFKNDKELVIEAIMESQYAYEYVSEELKKDLDVIITAINFGYEIQYLKKYMDSKLFQDRDFLFEIINATTEVISHL